MIIEIPLLASVVVLSVAFVAEKVRQKRSKQRRGIIHVNYDYGGYNNTKTNKTTVIVREIERVADESRVKIEHIDDAVNDKAIKAVKDHIGKWYPTKCVKWDVLPERVSNAKLIREEKKEQSKNKVTNEQLLNAVLNDDVKNM